MPTVWRTSFSIPLQMRRSAATKAAADGLSLASAVRMLLAGYVAGRITIVAAPASDVVTTEGGNSTP